jgi:hypothetical protein
MVTGVQVGAVEEFEVRWPGKASCQCCQRGARREMEAGVPKERGDIVLAYRRHIERQHDDD